MNTLNNNMKRLVVLLIFLALGSVKQLKAQCTAASASDSIQMVNFYNHFSGEDWSFATNWLTGPLESWSGVTLTEDGCHVEAITLANVGLIGNGLLDLQLPELTFLDLSGSVGIEGNLVEFTGMPKLEWFVMANTSVSGPLVDYQYLPNLKYITLYNNQLSGELPLFDSCESLVSLNLQANQLTGSIPNISLPLLTDLNVGENNMSGEIPDLSEGCPNMQQLLLASNNFEGELHDMSVYDNLLTINCRDNNLSGLIPIVNLPSMGEIDLRNNNFTGPFPDISNTSGLRIYLGGNNLVGNLPDFSELAINALDICPNNLIGVAPPFEDFPNLNFLQYQNIDFSCLNGVQLSGYVYLDENENCIFDETETGLGSIKVSDGDASYYVFSDNSGYFEINSEIGEHQIFPQLPNLLWNYSCPENLPLTVTSFSYDDDFQNLNMGLTAVQTCTDLSVEIWTPFFRACDQLPLFVDYCNLGTSTAEDAYVDVVLPEGNSSYSIVEDYEVLEDGRVRIYLGDIPMAFCGQIKIMLALDCDTVLGSTACAEVTIYPESDCNQAQPVWDGSDIQVRSSCEGDEIIFVISNVGESMQTPNTFRCYEDDVLSNIEYYQLEAGEEMTVSIPANGKAHRLTAYCNEGNPFHDYVQRVQELCGPAPFSLGFVNSSPNSNLAFSRDKFCTEVIGAYDPNDKTATPAGVSGERFVSPNQEIEYRIRFQNTGNDTAFWVQLVDTIDVAQLDIESLETRVASHNYTYQATGNVVTWTFNNILLPDSTTNETDSHGYVEFIIQQKANNPDGALIENFADIYFDNNEPVRTNTTMNTVCSDFDFLDLESLVDLEAASLENSSINVGETAMLLSEFNLEAETIALMQSDWQLEGNQINVVYNFVNDGIGCAPTQNQIAENLSLEGLSAGVYEINIDYNLAALPSNTTLTLSVLPAAPTISGTDISQPLCVGSSGFALSAEGSNVQWYADMQLQELLGEGNEYVAAAEWSVIYLVQSVDGLQSEPLAININGAVTPQFDIAENFCPQANIPELPGASLEGIPGTWSPALIDPQDVAGGPYVFTPDAGNCAESTTLIITPDQPAQPSFNLPQFCVFDEIPSLPETSLEGIPGTWSPAAIDPMNTEGGPYVFSPDIGNCAETTTVMITPELAIQPSFNLPEFCALDEVPALPETSLEGIPGTWSPAIIDPANAEGGPYVFSPASGNCAESTSVTITASTALQPSFNLPQSSCQFEEIELPEASLENLSGSWSPSSINTAMPGVYTFTFQADAACSEAYSYSIEIEPALTPEFESIDICLGDNPQSLETAAEELGLNGSWEPAEIDASQAGTTDYLFTPDAALCAEQASLSVTVVSVELGILYESGTLSTNIEDAISYQWYQGDELVSESSSHIPTTSGTYFVSITSSEGCSTISESIVVELESVSVQDLQSSSVALSPNPFASALNISLSNPAPASIEVFDLRGRLLVSQTISVDYTLDTASWPSGMYLLKVSQGDWTSTKRIIHE